MRLPGTDIFFPVGSKACVLLGKGAGYVRLCIFSQKTDNLTRVKGLKVNRDYVSRILQN